jgi:hypothetical protein
MPYISKDERQKLDTTINQLVSIIRDMTDPKDLTTADGRLNYTICRFLIGALGLVGEPKYHKFNSAVGILESVKLELTRRLTNGYEDKKIIENGDII